VAAATAMPVNIQIFIRFSFCAISYPISRKKPMDLLRAKIKGPLANLQGFDSGFLHSFLYL
jgi:hypothetical protein